MEYTVIRSRRRTIAIQLTPQGEILVRCPARMSIDDIDRFVRSKTDWIKTHLPKPSGLPVLSNEELRQLAAKAKAVLPKGQLILHDWLGSAMDASPSGPSIPVGAAAAARAT